MANYASITDIQRRLSKTFTSNTIPTIEEIEGYLEGEEQVKGYLDDADDFINGESVDGVNMPDPYGDLKQIAIDLVLKMINNVWSFRYPEQFPYVDIKLTPEQIRLIHKTHLKFAGKTWDLGN